MILASMIIFSIANGCFYIQCLFRDSNTKAMLNYLQEYTKANQEVADVEASQLSCHWRRSWNFIISISLRAEKYDRGVAMQAQFVFV